MLSGFPYGHVMWLSGQIGVNSAFKFCFTSFLFNELTLKDSELWLSDLKIKIFMNVNLAWSIWNSYIQMKYMIWYEITDSSDYLKY